MKINFRTGLPPEEQFHALFETTGWNLEYRATAHELSRALASSQRAISAYDGGLLIGFGRVVSDGSLHALICEMIVDPSYQGRGIGTRILRKLLRWCEEKHIRDIQLFCARGKRGFYEKNGFVARAEDAPGMQYRRRGELAGDAHPIEKSVADQFRAARRKGRRLDR